MKYMFSRRGINVGSELVCMHTIDSRYTVGTVYTIVEAKNVEWLKTMMYTIKGEGDRDTRFFITTLNMSPQPFIPLKKFPGKLQMVAKLTGRMPSNFLDQI